MGGQRVPGHAERAAGALLAVAVQDPVRGAVPGDPVLLLHRHLQRQQQPGRHLHHRGLRHRRLPVRALRPGGGAAAAGLHPRPDAGRKLPPLPAAVPRQLRHVLHASDQRFAACPHRRVHPVADLCLHA